MRRITTCVACALTFAAHTAVAVPLPNPAPAALAEDLDGSGYFTPGATLFGIEVFDVGEFLSVQPLTFGFFFAASDVSNPTNLIPIFGPDDLVNQQAVVNFGAGIVVDVDQIAVQGAFSGTGDIGFYVTLNSFGGGNLFSDPVLNGGTDYFGAYPFLADPTRLALSFMDGNSNALISLSVVNGITPAAATPVPEPGTLCLMAAGLFGLTRLRSRKN